VDTAHPEPIALNSPETYFNRELSWLAFARRVLALVEDPGLPLLERIKFAGIMGMLHDEFFMKRMSGLKRQVQRGRSKRSLDGRLPLEEFAACRAEIVQQVRAIERVLRDELRPALDAAGLPIHDVAGLEPGERAQLREQFRTGILPILTPLAVDAEHPFPFISNLGLNLAIALGKGKGGRERFVRLKVPGNRPRWMTRPGGPGVVPLEQVIAANLDLLFPGAPLARVHAFRVTRGAEGDAARDLDAAEDELREPGSIVRLVTDELKARRFAGPVRLEVDAAMPEPAVRWLASQLKVGPDDVYAVDHCLGLADLMRLEIADREELRYPRHVPQVHPRLRDLDPSDPEAIFDEIRRGDILLHHPYDSFDASVLRFLESAAVDPQVLAIKLTIYRTSGDSPIVRALAEAARRGKQVAVLVEITARFDEAPNIAWGELLENEGVHVAYGVERLKTHVKLALAVREEAGQVRRYAHIGTGNYHTGTARIYEDFGLLTAHPEICEDAAAVFNELTGATGAQSCQRLLVAPEFMRPRFIELIRREAEHARAGAPCGIYAKMNQLQDREMISALYEAARAGVPITLNVRGLCCLRPGVPGLSETIRVYSVVGRFLEHSRLYRFVNGGQPEYYTGSADWMKRNLENRVETIAPVLDREVQAELDRIVAVYEGDNCSAWDALPDGRYERRQPAPGEPRRAAQEEFIRLAGERAGA
jgi:polyphosphate kinase